MRGPRFDVERTPRRKVVHMGMTGDLKVLDYKIDFYNAQENE
jgi:hypothetical protein